MKKWLFVLVVMCAFVGCTGADWGFGDNNGSRIPEEAEAPYIRNVRKIIIEGLPDVSPRFGEALEVGVFYYEAGKLVPPSKQLLKRYTESGEESFPNGIDIYSYGSKPSINPPEFFLPYIFEDNILTIVVQKVDETIHSYGVNFVDVQKIIIKGLPAVTAAGEAVQAGIEYRVTTKPTIPIALAYTNKFYSEPGEYVFPDGIRISSILTRPNTLDPLDDTMDGGTYFPLYTFDQENKTLTINVVGVADNPYYHDVRKVIINGLPAVTAEGEAVQIEIGYYDVGKSPASPEELTKCLYAESGEHIFPEGIDIHGVKDISVKDFHTFSYDGSYENNVLTVDVYELPKRPEEMK